MATKYNPQRRMGVQPERLARPLANRPQSRIGHPHKVTSQLRCTRIEPQAIILAHQYAGYERLVVTTLVVLPVQEATKVATARYQT